MVREEEEQKALGRASSLDWNWGHLVSSEFSWSALSDLSRKKCWRRRLEWSEPSGLEARGAGNCRPVQWWCKWQASKWVWVTTKAFTWINTAQNGKFCRNLQNTKPWEMGDNWGGWMMRRTDEKIVTFYIFCGLGKTRPSQDFLREAWMLAPNDWHMSEPS